MTLNQLIEKLQAQQAKGKGEVQVLYRDWSVFSQYDIDGTWCSTGPFEHIDEVNTWTGVNGEESITLI